MRRTRDLTPSSRADAAALLKVVDAAGRSLEAVQTRTAAALAKAKANELDASFLTFAADLAEGRPITSDHVDGLDYAAFDIETTDQGFELERVVERLWIELESHRNLTKNDFAALSSRVQLEVPARETRFGVVTRQLDLETFAVGVGVLSNLRVNDSGAPLYDIQTRPGRKTQILERYRRGPVGVRGVHIVIPIDVADSREDGPLGRAERSHMTRYVERLTKLDELARRAVSLRGELQDKLRSIAVSGEAARELGLEDAVEGGRAVHLAATRDQQILQNLKSRVAGAARKAIDANRPAADLELLEYLSRIKGERPFTAKSWSRIFYQSFRCRPLLFEHARGMQRLWDLVEETAIRYEAPMTRRALRDWPAERQRVLELVDSNGSRGYGVAFREHEGEVVARVGVFRNCRRERVGRSHRYLAEWTPLGGGEARTLTELQPGPVDLSETPSRWFIRVDPDSLVGFKRRLVMPGGPLVSEAQDPYRRYLADLNSLSKAIQSALASGESFRMAAEEIQSINPDPRSR